MHQSFGLIGDLVLDSESVGHKLFQQDFYNNQRFVCTTISSSNFLSVFKVFLYSIICRKWLSPLVIMLSNNFQIFYILKDIENNTDNRKYCSCTPLISFVYETIFTLHI